VHVPLSSSGSQGRASNAAEVGRTAPEPSRERSAALEPVGRGEPAPVPTGCRELASESTGAKRSAPEQVSLDKLAKRVRV
jgi:hypothetical protein